MRIACSTLLLAAALSVSGTAAAHSELHSANWCTNGIVVDAGTFILTAAELRDESNRQQEAALQRCAEQAGQSPGFPGDGTCGIFDPPYEMAVAMARAACGDRESPVPTHSSPVVTFITDPPTFNDPEHHTVFKLDDGLKGICGVCLIIPPIVKPPAQN